MDMIERITEALAGHPLITAAGLCVSPEGMGDKESDVDIFVYCAFVPPAGERAALVSGISADYAPGGENTRWGICDLAHIDGEEVWLMYVTEQYTGDEVEEILAGKLPGKTDNYYYPVGRLATLKNIDVLFDKSGFLSGLKARLGEYPEGLARTLVEYHAEALLDTEDLERAAGRGDTLFYHFALDLEHDYFLQALFALNRVYFPSRKRSLRYISGFGVKPDGCCETLEKIVAYGSRPETLPESFELVKRLIDWTQQQARHDVS
jgi:hypothetical protein